MRTNNVPSQPTGPPPPRKKPKNLPPRTFEQNIAIALFLETYMPPLLPKPAPSRLCECPDYLNEARSGRPDTVPKYVAFTFHEAVVILNNIDMIASLPLKGKKQLITLCLDTSSSEERDMGAGGGWRLTTTRPVILSKLVWTECVNLYHTCLIYGSTMTEMCMDINRQIYEAQMLIPIPHEPAMPYRLAATESKGRRDGAPGESLYHRFGKLVWKLVYSDDLAGVLGCRDCGAGGVDWDYLEGFARDARKNYEPGSVIEYLSPRGNVLGVFSLKDDGDGGEVGELRLRRPPANTLKSEEKNMRRLLDLTKYKSCDEAATSAGCPTLPPVMIRIPPGYTTDAYKRSDAIVKRFDGFFTELKEWGKIRDEDRFAENIIQDQWKAMAENQIFPLNLLTSPILPDAPSMEEMRILLAEGNIKKSKKKSKRSANARA